MWQYGFHRLHEEIGLTIVAVEAPSMIRPAESEIDLLVAYPRNLLLGDHMT